MISQDRIDNYCVMAFKTIVKLLEERLEMSDAGMLESEFKRLKQFANRINRITDELNLRPFVKESTICEVRRLDQWYVEGLETLRSFVAERAKDGEISKDQYNRLWEIHNAWAETLRSLNPA